VGAQAFPYVVERDAVALVTASRVGHGGVDHLDLEAPAARARADLDDAPAGGRLDTVVDRVLDDGLQAEQRQARGRRQRGEPPAYLEALTEAQALDTEVAFDESNLLTHRDRLARIGQARAEEVGEILHRALGQRGLGARERGDGVHAVEEEMRTNARLQGLQSRLRLGREAVTVMKLHVEIAQHQRRNDSADEYRAQDQVAARQPRQRAGADERIDHPPGELRDRPGHEQNQQITEHGDGALVEAVQRPARQAQRGRGRQPEPLCVERKQSELVEKARSEAGCPGDDDERDQFAHHDHHEQCRETTQVGQEDRLRGRRFDIRQAGLLCHVRFALPVLPACRRIAQSHARGRVQCSGPAHRQSPSADDTSHARPPRADEPRSHVRREALPGGAPRPPARARCDILEGEFPAFPNT